MTTKQKLILVTGCAGFIGSHLVDKLLTEGYDVAGVDNLSTGTIEHIPTNNPKFKFYYLDFVDDIILKSILTEEYDYVFHLAAESSVPLTVLDTVSSSNTNIQKTIKLLDCCSKSSNIKRFIFSSSSAVYESLNWKYESFRTETMNEESGGSSAKSPYAIQKHTAEQFCKYYSNNFALDTICLRYFNVFGERQRSKTNIISGWLCAILEEHKTSVPIYGNSQHSRDYIPVSMVVDANIKAMNKEEKFNGAIINIGSGWQYSIEDIKNVFSIEFPSINFDYLDTRTGDASYTLASVSNMQYSLGINPYDYKPFREQLKILIQNYKETYKYGK